MKTIKDLPKHSRPRINIVLCDSACAPRHPAHDRTELEAMRKLVEANRELIARMEQKIQAKLAEIWGEPAEVRA